MNDFKCLQFPNITSFDTNFVEWWKKLTGLLSGNRGKGVNFLLTLRLWKWVWKTLRFIINRNNQTITWEDVLYFFLIIAKRKQKTIDPDLQQNSYLRRCLEMVLLSTVILLDGRITGSFMTHPMIGSMNSSGASSNNKSSSASNAVNSCYLINKISEKFLLFDFIYCTLIF